MEVEADPSLLVVNLEHCISSVESRQPGKNNTCLYTASMLNGVTDTSILQLAPVQCIGDIGQSLPRIQQQHLTQLQPIQYSQVSYDAGGIHPHGLRSHSLHQQHAESHHTEENALLGGLYSGIYQSQGLSASPYLPITSLQPPELPEPPKEPPPPSEPPEEPTFPLDPFQYYQEIKTFLVSNEYPPGASDNYKKYLRKRAQHYTVINNELHHGKKVPKKVVMKKEQQLKLVKKVHVIKETGVHLGVKKMFNKIRAEHSWRGMYKDVVNHVKQCAKCSDLADVAQQLKAKEGKVTQSEEDENDDPDDPPPTQSTRECAVQTYTKVWREVEIQLHGPFNMTNRRNEYIISITDPVSRFVCARAAPCGGLSSRIAEFTVQTFCLMGFAEANLICDIDLFQAVDSEYSWRVGDLVESVLTRVDTATCSWVSRLLEFMVSSMPTNWDREIDKYLFQFRVGTLKQFVELPLSSPFLSMYDRGPFSNMDFEDKENVKLSNQTEKQNPTQQKCQHCEVLFTTKVSLRLHEQKHFEDAKSDKSEHSSPKRKKLRKGSGHQGSKDLIAQSEELKPPVVLVESAVSAVKAYLAETKEERRRRGKYHKYSTELQEHMAEYALRHGNQKAAQHFSRILGTHVSDSTIRNIVKFHNSFDPFLKEEIGKFAANYGAERAANYYSEHLGKNIPLSFIRKFKSLYMLKHPNSANKGDAKNKKKKPPDELAPRINRYTPDQKFNIGRYSATHTIAETIEHFTEQGVPLNERTVKRFQKAYYEKKEADKKMSFETLNQSQPMEAPSIYPLTPPISFTPLVEPSPQLYHTNVCYQSQPVLMAQEPTLSDPGNQAFETLQHIYSQVTPNLCPPLGDDITQNQTTPLLTENTLLVSQSSSPALYEMSLQPMSSLKESEVIKMDTDEERSGQSCAPFSENMAIEREDYANKRTKEENSIVETRNDSSLESSRSSTKKDKKGKDVKRRGSYTTYSPELRAKIGRYAAQHGSLKACNFFSSLLGHDVPESTARGLKEKYLLKVKHCNVTSLGYSPRGRPLRLGKYDEVVQECLRELVRSGEKVSSFLAITTAREILNKHDPGLLKENGGTIVLNTTWAKSFLKRIGVRNNS